MDTVNVYSRGESERILGSVLADCGQDWSVVAPVTGRRCGLRCLDPVRQEGGARRTGRRAIRTIYRYGGLGCPESPGAPRARWSRSVPGAGAEYGTRRRPASGGRPSSGRGSGLRARRRRGWSAAEFLADLSGALYVVVRLARALAASSYSGPGVQGFAVAEMIPPAIGFCCHEIRLERVFPSRRQTRNSTDPGVMLIPRALSLVPDCQTITYILL